MAVRLPIYDHEDEIVDCVRRNRVTVVVGPTGSGKSTQIPLFLHRAGFGKSGIIGITEPRRIAATSLAEYDAGLLGVPLGDLVGYQIRFNETLGESTRIKFMTDGILLREMKGDPDLKKYSVIMIDEAHERSQNIDLSLGLAKALKRRHDLRVVVASATIDHDKFSRYFGNAPTISVSGTMYPVSVVWNDRTVHYDNLANAAVEKVHEIITTTRHGDILVFMTGEDDIRQVVDGIQMLRLPSLVVLPMYAALSFEDQQKIFADYQGLRKVVVATNIAETSITIDGIVYVVDGGYIKQRNFDPSTGIEGLAPVKHSRAGCEQRKGRAGRTRPGVCYRLYTEADFKKRAEFTVPEIRRSSLAGVVLAMEDLGIENIMEFDFIDPPERTAFREAYETLVALGAIVRGQKGLTELGRSMACLPLEPHIARMVLEADKYGCLTEIITIAAFFSVRNIYVRPEDRENDADRAHARFADRNSDAITFLNIWNKYKENNWSVVWCQENFLNEKGMLEVANIREQLLESMKHCGFAMTWGANDALIAKAVACGLVYNLFEHSNRKAYRAVLKERSRGVNVFIHPGSSQFHSAPRWFVATSVVETSRVYARNCTRVDPAWLCEIAPQLCTKGAHSLISYDPVGGCAQTIRPVHYKLHGDFLGYTKDSVSLKEAYHIQARQIEWALCDGLVPLVFRRSEGVHGGRWAAEHGGVEYVASGNGAIFEGMTYYCKLSRGQSGSGHAIIHFLLVPLPPRSPVE